MRKRTIAKKSIVAITICSSFMVVCPVLAFVWPVVDLSQVGQLVPDISTGISKVTAVKGQIETTIETVSAIGDPAALIAKYNADFGGSAAIVGKMKIPTMKVQNNTEYFVSNANTASKDSANNNQITVQTVTQTIDSQIENGASEEEVQTTIQDTKDEIWMQNQETREEYQRATDELLNATDELINNLNDAKVAIETDDKLEKAEKDKYNEEIDELVKKAENFKDAVQKAFNDIMQQFDDEYSKQMLNMLDEYSQKVTDFYAGNISREELAAITEKLQTSASTVSLDIDSEQINNLISMAKDLGASALKLQESILNSLSNSREYNDEDTPDKTSYNEKYFFHYNSTHTSAYADSIYSKGVPERDKTFLISKELMCHHLRYDDLTELEKSDKTNKLRKCVSLAKTNKDYTCTVEVGSKDCDPYALEPNKLYEPYREYGVYNHIVEDYSVANIETGARNQQYSQSWRAGESSKYEELTKLISNGTVGDQKAAYQTLSLIEFEAVKQWGKIRLVDAVYRAKKAVQRFSAGTRLYLNALENSNGGSNEDVKVANETTPGLDKKISTKDGRHASQQIFSNVFLYHCGLTAENIAIEMQDKYNVDETEKVEKKFAVCLYKYAVASSNKYKDAKRNETYCGRDFTIEQCSRLWEVRKEKAVDDSYFHTFVLATTNSYKSSDDYATHPTRSDKNIKTFEKEAEGVTDALSTYTYGAEVNYYTTMQILSVVDADAQQLQTEILETLPEISYNYFDESFNREAINATLNKDKEIPKEEETSQGGGN